MPKLIHTNKLPGIKFNRLTFLEETQDRDKDGKRLSKFRCECGKVITKPFFYVAKGVAKSCGCLNTETRKANAKKANAAVTMIGRRFGSLVVVSQQGVDKRSKSPIWLCKCDCGQDHLSSGKNLRGGVSKRCTACSLDTRSEEIEAGLEKKKAVQHQRPEPSAFYQSLPAFLR